MAFFAIRPTHTPRRLGDLFLQIGAQRQQRDLQREHLALARQQADRAALQGGIKTLGEIVSSDLPDSVQQFAIGKLGQQLGIPEDFTKLLQKQRDEERAGTATLLQSIVEGNPNLTQSALQNILRHKPLEGLRAVAEVMKQVRARQSQEALDAITGGQAAGTTPQEDRPTGVPLELGTLEERPTGVPLEVGTLEERPTGVPLELSTLGERPPGRMTETPIPGVPSSGPTGLERLPAIQQKIARMALELGLPPEIGLAAAHQETGGTFDNALTGKDGEVGIFQILPSTGQELGYTPEQLRDTDTNIRAGLTYLKRQIDAKGSIAAGLTRYNGGGKDYAGNVLRHVPRYSQALNAPGEGASAGGREVPLREPLLSPQALQQLQGEIARIDQQVQAITTSRAIDQGSPEVERILTRLDRRRQHLVAERDRQTTLATSQATRQNAQLEAQLKRKELEAKTRAEQGRLLPAEQLKARRELVTSINDERPVKAFQLAQNFYGLLQEGAASEDAIGDFAMVQAINRLFNPDNAVLISESKQVAGLQGALNVFAQLPKRFTEGDQLRPEFRQRLLELGRDVLKRMGDNADQQVQRIYAPIARQIGVPLDEVYTPSKGIVDQKPLTLSKEKKQAADKLLDAVINPKNPR